MKYTLDWIFFFFLLLDSVADFNPRRGSIANCSFRRHNSHCVRVMWRQGRNRADKKKIELNARAWILANVCDLYIISYIRAYVFMEQIHY